MKLMLAVILVAGFILAAPLLAHEGDDHEEPESGPPLILGVLDFPNSVTLAS